MACESREQGSAPGKHVARRSRDGRANKHPLYAFDHTNYAEPQSSFAALFFMREKGEMASSKM